MFEGEDGSHISEEGEEGLLGSSNKGESNQASSQDEEEIRAALTQESPYPGLYIPSSLNIPVAQFESTLRELAADPDIGIVEMARRLNVSGNVIYRSMKYFSISKVRHKSFARPGSSPTFRESQKDTARFLYEKVKLSYQEIAKVLGVSDRTIAIAIREAAREKQLTIRWGGKKVVGSETVEDKIRKDLLSTLEVHANERFEEEISGYRRILASYITKHRHEIIIDEDASDILRIYNQLRDIQSLPPELVELRRQYEDQVLLISQVLIAQLYNEIPASPTIKNFIDVKGETTRKLLSVIKSFNGVTVDLYKEYLRTTMLRVVYDAQRLLEREKSQGIEEDSSDILATSSSNIPTPEEKVVRDEENQYLNHLISLLLDNEQIVINAYYGVNSPPMNFREIGEAYFGRTGDLAAHYAMRMYNQGMKQLRMYINMPSQEAERRAARRRENALKRKERESADSEQGE